MTALDAPIREALAKAGLRLAATTPWREVTLFALAEVAGLSVAELYPATRSDVVDAIEEAFDRAMATDLTPPDPDVSTRDRLFDILMRRFEAMEPHRDAVTSLEAGADRDPVQLGAGHVRAVRSARWALSLAGLDADGVAGQARAQGLAVILTQARTAWRTDLSGDFAKTMASLDKNLRRAEETFGRWSGLSQPKPVPEDAKSPAGPPGESAPG